MIGQLRRHLPERQLVVVAELHACQSLAHLSDPDYPAAARCGALRVRCAILRPETSVQERGTSTYVTAGARESADGLAAVDLH